jgi:ribosomal protein S18 acetylase RimI-like enzyme
MHDVDIVRATVDDAQALAACHVRAWRWAYRGVLPQKLLDDLDEGARAVMWRGAVGDDATRVWAARENGEIVGLCAAGPARGDANAGEIYAIYLDEHAAGRGDGKRMLDVALADLRRRFKLVVLWVLGANERARAFYERNGFAHDGATKVEVVNGCELHEVRYLLRF